MRLESRRSLRVRGLSGVRASSDRGAPAELPTSPIFAGCPLYFAAFARTTRMPHLQSPIAAGTGAAPDMSVVD
jgi:hypothetical protein